MTTPFESEKPKVPKLSLHRDTVANLVGSEPAPGAPAAATGGNGPTCAKTACLVYTCGCGPMSRKYVCSGHIGCW